MDRSFLRPPDALCTNAINHHKLPGKFVTGACSENEASQIRKFPFPASLIGRRTMHPRGTVRGNQQLVGIWPPMQIASHKSWPLSRRRKTQQPFCVCHMNAGTPSLFVQQDGCILCSHAREKIRISSSPPRANIFFP